jgi:hypothetical protein
MDGELLAWQVHSASMVEAMREDEEESGGKMRRQGNEEKR